MAERCVQCGGFRAEYRWRYCSDTCRNAAEREKTRARAPRQHAQPVDTDTSVVEAVLRRNSPNECTHNHPFVASTCTGCLLLDKEIAEIRRRRAL